MIFIDDDSNLDIEFEPCAPDFQLNLNPDCYRVYSDKKSVHALPRVREIAFPVVAPEIGCYDTATC